MEIPSHILIAARAILIAHRVVAEMLAAFQATSVLYGIPVPDLIAESRAILDSDDDLALLNAVQLYYEQRS